MPPYDGGELLGYEGRLVWARHHQQVDGGDRGQQGSGQAPQVIEVNTVNFCLSTSKTPIKGFWQSEQNSNIDKPVARRRCFSFWPEKEEDEFNKNFLVDKHLLVDKNMLKCLKGGTSCKVG